MRIALIIIMKLLEVSAMVFVPWGIGFVLNRKIFQDNPHWGVEWIMGLGILAALFFITIIVLIAVPEWFVLNGRWADIILER